MEKETPATIRGATKGVKNEKVRKEDIWNNTWSNQGSGSENENARLRCQAVESVRLTVKKKVRE